MDYTRKTVELLMERYPEYLAEMLCGITIDLQKETAESITAMIAHRNLAEVKHHESSIYTCKCGSNFVVTREVQTRSSDEGSTIVHICEKCGNTY
jgi:DNA-directed RNA polymerase subunit M/transcription elongation factor TFIIS